MRKKNLIVSAVSLICMVCLVIGVVSGCGKDKAEPSGDASSSAVTGAITVISREDGSGTRDAFTELMDVVDADGNDATVQTAEITNSTSVMMSTVKGNAKSIGYVSLGSLSDTVKAVSIDGVAPSVETVKDGSYKLQRPFKIAYIDGTLSDTAKDFLSFIMSTEGEKIIGEEGYIVLDTADTYQPSGVSGTVSLAGSTSVAPVMNVLADKYKQLNPDVKIEIQESGSSAGIESALQGAVDIAMSSRELKEDEAKALKAETIALDGIAVIVNAENGIDNLTSQQIKSIFNGEIKVWEDVK